MIINDYKYLIKRIKKMKGIFDILGIGEIIGQIIVWTLAFYWTDFDLLCYILEGKNTLTSQFLYIMPIIFFQVLLIRNFYFALTVHSTFLEKGGYELANIDENNQLDICKKCGSKKPIRVHHCRYCNKCIDGMDHHCFVLNHCIGKKNYNYFIGYILLTGINSIYIFVISLYVIIKYIDNLETYNLMKYGLLCIIAFIASISSIFYLFFHVYLYYFDLTTIEFIYPSLKLKNKKKADLIKEESSKDKKKSSILQKIIELFYP